MEQKLRRVLRRPAVEKATGLGRSSIYQGMSEGWFPNCFPLSGSGRAVGWWEDEIIAYQEERGRRRRESERQRQHEAA